MELRSTGNPDTSNSVTMSMLEYLAKKGRETMSGICKYSENVCPHMTVLKGKSYCDATPCQLTGELPKQTFEDKIRSMNNYELAMFLSEFSACNVCEHYIEGLNKCDTDMNFLCVKAYAEGIIGRWLKQPVED